MFRHALLLLTLPAIIAVLPQSGHSTVLLPTSNFGCTSNYGTDCSLVSQAVQLGDPGTGVEGVKAYLTSPIDFSVTYAETSGGSFTPDISLFTSGAVYGTVNGLTCSATVFDGCGELAIPQGSTLTLSYDFDIEAGGEAALDSWNVVMVSGGFPTIQALGTGTGTHTGSQSVTLQHDVLLGDNVSFNLSVEGIAHVPTNGFGDISIDIPSHSLDLNISSTEPTPEPSTFGLMGLAGLLGLAARWSRRGRRLFSCD
jgi:hypothetical protein